MKKNIVNSYENNNNNKNNKMKIATTSVKKNKMKVTWKLLSLVQIWRRIIFDSTLIAFIDLTMVIRTRDSYLNRTAMPTTHSESHEIPPFVGSGGPTVLTSPLPKFPNNVELVKNEKHSELLKALLPTLNKHNCLEYTAIPRRRSPFVRTFVDLHHPSGPWDKFSNAPDISSKAKYRFKSYTLPKIYQTLKECENTTNPVHLELRNALRDYMSKEKYFKDFVDKAKKIAHIEVNKPASEREPIATMSLASPVEVEVAAVFCEEDQPETPSSAANGTAGAKTTGLADTDTRKRPINDVSSPEKESEPVPACRRLDSDEFSQGGESVQFEEENNTLTGATYAAASQVHDRSQVQLTPPSTPPPAPKNGISDSCEDASTMRTPQATVDIQDQQHVTPTSSTATTSSDSEEEKEEEVTNNNSQQHPHVTPTSSTATPASEEKVNTMESTRAKLVKLLQVRRGGDNNKFDNDPLCQKIQSQIDRLDEEMFNIVLQQ